MGHAGVDLRDGRWRVRIRRRGFTRIAYFPTEHAAVAWRATTLDAIARGEAPPVPTPPPPAIPARPVTVADACVEFVEGMVTGAIRTPRGHSYKASTVRGVENRLRLYVVPAIGAVPLARLRRGDVQRLVDGVAASTSPATAANVRDALRVVMSRQVALEVVDINPAAGVRAPVGDRAPARFLTPDEADRLQAVADGHPHPVIGPLVAVALATGLRLGELQAVAWGPDGVDVDAGLVHVLATRDRTGVIVPTKSRRPRTVPLGPEVAARMRRYRLAAGRPPDGARVFARSHRRAWDHVRDAAGLPGLRVHDLRHTAASYWLAAGLSVHAVADLLGHVDATLVLRLYGHALPREVSSAGERMAAWRAVQRAT